MVVGNGMIANGFSHYATDEKVLIFASGVSNSKENADLAFQREKKLLKDSWQLHQEKLLVYFSTCSMYDPEQQNSPYVKHKLALEESIEGFGTSYIICRVSNVVGNTNNKATIFNYLINNVKEQQHFNLWKNAYRNIIDLEDVVKITNYLIENPSYYKTKINIANPVSFRVTSLVQEIEQFLQTKALFKVEEKGSPFFIDTAEIREIINDLNLDFNNFYIRRILEKYFKYS